MQARQPLDCAGESLLSHQVPAPQPVEFGQAFQAERDFLCFSPLNGPIPGGATIFYFNLDISQGVFLIPASQAHFSFLKKGCVKSTCDP